MKKGIDKPRPVTEANLVRIYCGAHDLLAGEAVEFGTHAKSFGLDVSLHCLPEGQHNFIFGAGRVPEVDQATWRWLGGYDSSPVFLRYTCRRLTKDGKA